MSSALLPDKRPQGVRGPRRVAGILAGQLVLLLLVTEVGLRLAPVPGFTRLDLDPPHVGTESYRRLGPHPYIALTPKPGWNSDPTRAKQASHNSLGFRGPEITWEKPEEVFRIVCMGGSSTYGNGPTADDKTWPARLQQHLRRLRPERAFQVVNSGAPTWSTFESLANLCFRVVDLDPDLVIVYHATNDASPALYPDPVPDNTHWRRVWPVFEPSPIERFFEWSMTYLVWRRYCTDYVERRSDLGHVTIANYIPGYEDPYGDGPLPDQGFHNYERNLVSIISVARGHGVPIVFMTQAMLAEDSNSFNSGRNRKRAIDRMTVILEQVTTRLDVPLVDMKTYLEGEADAQLRQGVRQTVFTNNVHMTNHGANLFATHLAAELLERGLVD